MWAWSLAECVCRYVPYNKITSVMQWIMAKHAELPKDQIVVIIDVDVVLLEDISYFAVNVKKGFPLGAKVRRKSKE